MDEWALLPTRDSTTSAALQSQQRRTDAWAGVSRRDNAATCAQPFFCIHLVSAALCGCGAQLIWQVSNGLTSADGGVLFCKMWPRSVHLQLSSCYRVLHQISGSAWVSSPKELMEAGPKQRSLPANSFLTNFCISLSSAQH